MSFSETKVHIASSRPEEIGNRCKEWAAQNTPAGSMLTEDPDECEVFISVLYGTLLTKEFIDKRRCYNFHPGLLPDYRGAGAYSWALINKEAVTGVTLHEIDYHIDSGPIIAKREIEIEAHDTAGSLFECSMNVLFEMFTHWLCPLLMLKSNYPTKPNKGGTLYVRGQLEEAKDVTHIVRAFTFEGKESAYFHNQGGEKIYLKW